MMNDIVRREDLTEENEPILEKKPKKKRKIFKFIVFSIIFFITIVFVFSNQVMMSDNDSTSWFSRLPIIKQLKYLAESSDRMLKGESDDRINVLLIGMGGKYHEGGYLADTIMLASLEPTTKKVALVSVPRDLAVPVEGKDWQKINSINAYAEMAEAGSGSLATSQALSDILETPIDYYIRVDFEGFVNIIDEIDGIDVLVENTLDDYSYPVAGREEAEDYESRFEHLHVEKGLQTMDGNLALKFARSRHGINGEGSDFARAKRQQLVIEAVKTKALSKKNLFNPKVIAGIIGEFNEHIDTNLKIWEMIKLWDIFKDTNRTNITNKVLDNSVNGLLKDGRNESGQYVLSPNSGDFAEIQYFVNSIFSDAPLEVKTKVIKEKSTVEVRNGTWVNGLASQAALDIEKFGFIVTRVGNSNKQNFQKSVIYDLTFGEKMDSLTVLKEKTGANISFGIPEWLTEDISAEIEGEVDPIQPDFIIILGQDADQTHSGAENEEKN
jgi:polyisoprenyl-teichoic acid--peptidoglycan teichoic acid transferase